MPAKFPVQPLAFLLRASLLAILIMGGTPENHSFPAILAYSPDDSVASQQTRSAAPAAAFSATPTRGLPPLDVQLSVESTGAPLYWAWYFGDGDFDSPWTSPTVTEWSARLEHSSVVLPDGSIVLLGCLGASGPPKNDVWCSTNLGVTWVQLTAAAEWPGRTRHASVVLSDGSIVLMGGLSADSPTNKNDVWRSIDGDVTWVQQTVAAPWARRSALAAVALPDDSIILLGGDYLSTLLNDVWRSADQGGTWVQLDADAEWTARGEHTVAVLPDGSVMLVGGYDGVTRLRDVWRWETAGASEQHPAHTYTALGTYSVALQVANAGGYSSLRRVAYIRVTAIEDVPVYLPLVLRSTP